MELHNLIFKNYDNLNNFSEVLKSTLARIKA